MAEERLGAVRDALTRGLEQGTLDASLQLAVPLAQLLGSGGALLREIERAGGVAASFRVPELDVGAPAPFFPGATLIADRFDAAGAKTSELDASRFLRLAVLVIDGRALSVGQAVALTASSTERARLEAHHPALAACMRALASVTLDAVHRLGDGGARIEDLPLITHAGAGAHGSVFLPRAGAIRRAGFDVPLAMGLSWAAALRLVPGDTGRRVIYEVGDVEPGKLLLSVGTSAQGVFVLCQLDASTVLEVTARRDLVRDRYFRIIVNVRASAESSRLRVWIDDRLAGGARSGPAVIDRLTGAETLGAGLLGRHRCALFVRELMLIARPLSPVERLGVLRHLGRHVDG